MIQNFTDLPAVELEVGVGEVDEGDAADKNDPPRVLVSLGSEWIITHFVTKRLIVEMMFFLEGVTASVPIENVLMAKWEILAENGETYLESFMSL